MYLNCTVDWGCCQVVYSVGIMVNEERVDDLQHGILKMVMALNLYIGYDK